MAQAIVLDVEVHFNVRLPFWTALKLRLAGKAAQQVIAEKLRQLNGLSHKEPDHGADW